MRREIAIAGCGPGGLAAALFLHRLGHAVTLYERFRTPRPLGSGLLVQPSGQAVLGELDLIEPIHDHGAPIAFLSGTDVVSGKRALDVRYGALNGACAYGVHRSLLFGTLFEAVSRTGIAIETGRTVTGAQDGCLQFENSGRSPRFDCIVDALGAGTPLAPRFGRSLDYGALWATLDWPAGGDFLTNALDQRYRRAREMAGVMPIGTHPVTGRMAAAFFWSVRADAVDDLHDAGTVQWRKRVLALWPEAGPLLDQIDTTEEMVFAHYAHRTVRRPLDGRIVHLGDAWHSTSPQLGQGANMALLDAAALGKAFERFIDIDAALAHYAWLRSSHIRLYQALSAIFTPLYQSDDGFRPFIRDQLVHHFAGLWPARTFVATLVSGNLGWPLRPMGIGGGA